MRKFFIGTAFLITTSAFASGSLGIDCSNPPAKKWGTYYCLSGSVDLKHKSISESQFGTCEGSDEAEESEPATTVELKEVLVNKTLAASSPQWKDAIPFDFSNPTFGDSVLLIHPEDLKAGASFEARIKVQNPQDGASSDAKVTCTISK